MVAKKTIPSIATTGYTFTVRDFPTPPDDYAEAMRDVTDFMHMNDSSGGDPVPYGEAFRLSMRAHPDVAAYLGGLPNWWDLITGPIQNVYIKYFNLFHH
jgi:hypothetical protein